MMLQDILEAHRYRLGGTCTCGEWSEEDDAIPHSQHVTNVIYGYAEEEEIDDIEFSLGANHSPPEVHRSVISAHVNYAMNNHSPTESDCRVSRLRCSSEEHMVREVTKQLAAYLEAIGLTVPD